MRRLLARRLLHAAASSHATRLWAPTLTPSTAGFATTAALAPSSPALTDLLPAARSGPRPSTLCAQGSDKEVEAVRFEPHAPPRVVRTTPSALGLAPRDAALLRPPSSSGGGGGQRATLAARDVVVPGPDGKPTAQPLILVRTEAVRAAVGRSSALIFPAKRAADTAALLAAVDAAAAASSTPFGPPFELAILEALLSESVRVFDRRARQLRLLADGVENDVARALRWAGGAAASTGELGRLLPVQRALTEVLHDVREARGAVEGVTASPRALAALCLTDNGNGKRNGDGEGAPPPSLRAAEALFESYERQLQSVEGALHEMGENLDAAREAWGIALDAHRNRTLRLSLHMSLATAAVAIACGTPAAFLGANIDVPSFPFWPLVTGCSLAALAGYGGLVSLWQILPTMAHRQSIADAKALRDLLHHLDDLDAVLAAVRTAAAGAAGGRLSKDAFSAAVTGAGAALRRDEVEALFRMYDVNDSGFLEEEEVVRRTAAWGSK